MGNKKYRVKLTAEEREQLEEMLRKGRGSAQHLLKVRILLKADEGESGEHWSDGRICGAIDVSGAHGTGAQATGAGGSGSGVYPQEARRSAGGSDF